MTDLQLSDSEQAAVRALIAVEPIPGTAMPGDCVLPHVSRLIACDAIGMTLVDSTDPAVQELAVLREPGATQDRGAATAPLVGINQRDCPPAKRGSATPRGFAVLSLGVRNGPDHVAKLWMIRRTNGFSARDRAMLALVAPALERLMRQRPTSALPPSLTHQERRVLHEVAAGLTNAEIAERLFVAPCTVRKHLENAYRKLGVTNRMAAIVALEGGRHGDRGRTEFVAGLA